jgi:hypothetical protein
MAMAQFRVATWNISNYSGGRDAALKTALYGEFEGRSLAPDILLVQEFLSQAATDAMLVILNTAPGSPGDWAAAPFVNGPDTDSAFFYRTSRVDYLGMTIVAVGGAAPNHPRNIQRYDVRLVGYDAPEATIACYSAHMKAGSASTDQARRLVEAQRIRDDAETLPAGWNFLLGGDFNIQSSSQSAYVEMVGSQLNDAGRLFDPIATPGSWNNNGAFRMVHTQDPVGAGGMDDRHDQLLLSGSLVDGASMDYIGNPSIPYSTTTWDDPNHSYRSWGNDGTSFDLTMKIADNTMVGPTIAQALVTTANGAGHLPIVLNLRVPARSGTDTEVLDFGQVAAGAVAELPLAVFNDGDTALWNAEGIADLNYTVGTTGDFSTTPGAFADAAGGGSNEHFVAMDTSTPGIKAGTFVVSSDDPDQPVRVVTLVGEVVSLEIPGDFDGNQQVDLGDYLHLADCLAGPNQAPAPVLPGATAEACLAVFDFDDDDDVDLRDAGEFMKLMP